MKSFVIGVTLILLVSVWASGYVVSSNNLNTATVGTGSLTANAAPVYASFPVSTGPLNVAMLNGVTATVQSTANPFTANGITLDAISPVASPTVGQLLAKTVTNVVGGSQYGPAADNLPFIVAPGVTSLNYHLGLFAYTGAWQWQATNITEYAPALADGGNLVPNASLENTNVNFWSYGGTFASDPGVQGSTVWDVLSTSDTHIGIPVVPGVPVKYDFWAKGIGIWNYVQMEVGFSVPVDGGAFAPGNATFGLALGTSPWTEFSGTMTPAAGQTMFYIGGMTAGGDLRFDSVLVMQYTLPEPATMALLGLGVLGLISRRRA